MKNYFVYVATAALVLGAVSTADAKSAAPVSVKLTNSVCATPAAGTFQSASCKKFALSKKARGKKSASNGLVDDASTLKDTSVQAKVKTGSNFFATPGGNVITSLVTAGGTTAIVNSTNNGTPGV